VRIRTITFFADVSYPLSSDRLDGAGRALAVVKQALVDDGHLVQTTRLALPALAATVAGARQVGALAHALDKACGDRQIDYATIGVVRSTDPAAFFDAIPDALGSTARIFASALIAERGVGLSVPAVRHSARIIRRATALTADGFGNLRFAALANVPPGVPFLPAAYHAGGDPILAIGVEGAELAVAAFEQAASLQEGREILKAAIEREAARIASVAGQAAGGVRMTGVDFSMAPYPTAARSIATVLERITGGRVGEHATLGASAFLADSIDRASFARAGYSGMFLPVFEDAVLAARAAEGLFTVNDLLLWSSVCGTGLDTVPLAGDIDEESLAAILLDVGALALRLDKPLTARLMPIPGKHAGDPIAFDFPYFAPTRVLATRASALGGLLDSAGAIDIQPRRWRAPQSG
jgi:hypothetical protein